MPRATFVIRDGRLVSKDEAAPLVPHGPASGLARPSVIGDGCEFVSMASGKVVTSKSAYRADLRARGLVEVGNEDTGHRRPETKAPAGMTHDIRRAISQLAA